MSSKYIIIGRHNMIQIEGGLFHRLAYISTSILNYH